MNIGEIQARVAADTGTETGDPSVTYLGAILLRREHAASRLRSHIADVRDDMDKVERRLDDGDLRGLAPHNINASGVASVAAEVQALDEAYDIAAEAFRNARVADGSTR